MASTLPNTYFQLSSTDEVGNDSVHSMLRSSTTVSITDPNKKKLGLASFVILTVYAVNGVRALMANHLVNFSYSFYTPNWRS